MASKHSRMNRNYGRPRTFEPVAVQDRLPWIPRRSDGRVQVVLMHPLLADEFVEACWAASRASSWVPGRIDSYVPRAIRNYFKNDTPPKGWQLGDKGTSNHSWASAVDMFSTPADVWPPGGVWTPDDPVPEAFAAEFEKRGWTLGAKWKRKDTPHHEFSKEPPRLEINGRMMDEEYVDWLTAMLKQGDRGLEVLDLQLGILMLKLDGELTGIFGPKTDANVREIQKLGKTKVDGIVGPATEKVIAYLWAQTLPTDADVVTLAYDRVLGRAPSQNEIGIWVEQIRLEDLNPSELARRIYYSPEATEDRHGSTIIPPKPAPPATNPGSGAATPPPPPPSPPTDGIDVRAQLLKIAELLVDVANSDQLK